MNIFPFLDGNRRVGQLLLRRLLVQMGHPVVRYVDLESEITATIRSFYRSLYQGTRADQLQPWLTYCWVLLRRLYQRFDKQVRRANITQGRGSKTTLIKHFVHQQDSPFLLSDICQAYPTISRDMIRAVLRDLRDQGAVSTTRGRNAVWVKHEGRIPSERKGAKNS